MSRELVFLPAASRDYAEAFQYYETLSPGFGGPRFEASFRQSIEQIEDGLVTHRLCFGFYHRVLIQRFPFTIYYRLHADKAIIVAILYSRYAPEKIRALIASRNVDG